MKITWYIEDGYAGAKRRPHYVNIDDEDILDLTEEEKQEYIYKCIEDEFYNKCSFFYKEE